MPSSRTQDRPRALGRKGERVANTPIRVLPPSLGGRTVGDQSSLTASENCQISQMWEKPSRPRRASGFRYSGSNTIRASSSSTIPAWRGMPNLVGKSLLIRAMAFIVYSIGLHHGIEQPHGDAVDQHMQENAAPDGVGALIAAAEQVGDGEILQQIDQVFQIHQRVRPDMVQ